MREKLLKQLIALGSNPEGSYHVVDEWVVLETYYDQGDNTCECGQEHIRQCSIIINTKTGHRLFPIGSECVKHFGIGEIHITCLCCKTEVSLTNKYVQAYMRYKSISRETKLILHKKCFQNAKETEYALMGIRASFQRYGWRNVEVSLAYPEAMEVYVSAIW